MNLNNEKNRNRSCENNKYNLARNLFKEHSEFKKGNENSLNSSNKKFEEQKFFGNFSGIKANSNNSNQSNGNFGNNIFNNNNFSNKDFKDFSDKSNYSNAKVGRFSISSNN